MDVGNSIRHLFFLGRKIVKESKTVILFAHVEEVNCYLHK